jgi:hypothetical protein
MKLKVVLAAVLELRNLRYISFVYGSWIPPVILGIAAVAGGGGYGGGSSETAAQRSAGTAPSPSDRRAKPMRVEPNARNTFGPGVSIPSGTTLYLQIVTKVETGSFRLHVCGTPCYTARTVEVWEPASFRSGDVLTHLVTEAGEYYLWHKERSSGNPSPATADKRRQNGRRITFKSGAVVDAWYVPPEIEQMLPSTRIGDRWMEH